MANDYKLSDGMRREVLLARDGESHAMRWDMAARWTVQRGGERKLLDALQAVQACDPAAIADWFLACLESGRALRGQPAAPYTAADAARVADAFPLDALNALILRVFTIGNQGVGEGAAGDEGKATPT